MRIFVTGATGFVGSAIVQELLGAGHHVLGLARSEAAAQTLTAAGAEVHRGSLDDLDSLRRGAAASDGVIHCAFIHDFTQYAAAAEADRRAVEAVGAALAGSDRPFIVTSGFAGLTRQGDFMTEEDTLDPNLPAMRHSEGAALALVPQGVRAMVMRLAASVHDKGDHGFVPTLIAIARQKGVAAYIGDGSNRWPAVHRLDAAHLYRLALENGTAGARYHGVADAGIPMRDIAAVIGRHLNVPVASVTQEEAPAHFGWMAGFAGLDLAASSSLTQQRLSWHPSHPALFPDLEQGHYFTAHTI
ncbi:SDR family oxidoreductase [Hymenobacter sp. BT186]|uniref:SDR family oxidoreductase n=1 Tax=Hymenobacter telluris TaxID=2816474 RepID=A0A939JA09_9BACT|nr:SDR family oxidoreductase [Hymenobacter telluris]MBO0359379.1 SDR family oxidoreductase [Hymenobacter telluris]MBW3375405.1 SDR family oxidoreductase [Hymenobacter norwichensis]